MKKIYLIFFTLILGAMVIPKAQAQCPSDSTIKITADVDCSAAFSWDHPDSVTYYVLSGATVDTVNAATAQFNVGSTLIEFWDGDPTLGTSASTSCSFTLRVYDDVPPVIDGFDASSPFVAYLDSGGNVIIAADTLISSVTDCHPDSALNFTLDDGNPSITLNCNLAGQDTTVNVLVEDPDGNVDSTLSVISVMDTLAPYIECKDTVLYVDENGDAGFDETSDALVDSVWENCTSLSYVIDNFEFTCEDVVGNTTTGLSPGDSIEVTTTVTDGASLTNTCISQVVVLDTTPPSFTPPSPDTTLYLSDVLQADAGSGADTLAAMAFDIPAYTDDNCTVDTMWFTPNEDSLIFDCGDVGDNDISLVVQDIHGNNDTTDFTVIVADTVAPHAVCQDIVVKLDETGMATITAVDGVADFNVNNNSWDNCSIDSLGLTADTFYCDPDLTPGLVSVVTYDSGDTLYSGQVTMTVKDASDNLSTCTSTVYVRDTIPPVPVCKNDTVYLDSMGYAYTFVGDLIEDITDNADDCILEVDTAIIDGYVAPWECEDVDPEDQLITVLATDKAGNDSICQAIVVVKDTFPPTPVCQDVDVYLDANGQATLTAVEVGVDVVGKTNINGGSWDACGIASYDLSEYILNCTSPHMAFTSVSEKSAQVNGGHPYPAYPYTYPVEMTVTDVNGISNTCTSTVTVHDTIAPTPDCQPIVVTLDENGEATVTVPMSSGVAAKGLEPDLPGGIKIKPIYSRFNGYAGTGSYDNCEVYYQEVEQTVFTCAHIATNPADPRLDDLLLKDAHLTNTVLLTVWDYAGNSSTCEVPVFVVDDDAPTAMCKDTTLYLDAEGMIDLDLTSDSIMSIFDDGSYDNTDCLDYSVMPLSLGCEDVSEGTATTAVTLTVTDAGGNTATCVSNVTVLDTIAPVIDAEDHTVYLHENGEYVLSATEIEYIINRGAGMTSDNCTAPDDLDISIDPVAFECLDALTGPVEITITATDEYDNESMGMAWVTVIDTFAPVMNCKDTLDVYLDEDGEALIFPGYVNDAQDRASVPDWARTLNDLEGGSWDACGIDSAWVSQQIFDCSSVGTPDTVMLWGADPSGNVSTCSTVVMVHDTIAPTITVDVADTLMVVAEPGECEVEITYPTAVALDNCSATLSLVSGVGPDSTFMLGATTETWVATDASGNTSEEVSFVVMVTTTNAAPTLDSIPDATVMEDAGTVHVDVTGISYGIDCVEEDVMVYAEVTSGTAATLDTVMYTAGNDSAKLALTTVPDMNGDVMVAVTVVDAAGDSITKTMTLTVEPVNDAPVLVTPIADQTVNASYELAISVSSVLGEYFDDIDGDVLTLTAMVEGGAMLPTWVEIVGDTLYATPMIADTGCYNMVVEASDGELTATDTFQVCVEGYPTAIDDIGAGQFEVNLYPNPTRGMVNIDIESSSLSDVELTVLDITGKQVLRKQYRAAERITFDMSGKVSGMYFVKLDFEGKQVLKKLVVDRK